MDKVKDFKADVMHEINMLKEHATQEEKLLLDFAEFDFNHPRQCIYGQLTGACYSLRAKELMDKCCIRVMDLKGGVDEIENVLISDDEFVINGPNTGQGWEGSDRSYAHLSALEGYICTKGAKNKEIIAYIKGEQATLVL
jgi:hypothetical protein